MPVSNISAFVEISSNLGARRWIEYDLLVWISPRPSIGSPTTFNILPNTSGPTGTCIGFPVFVTVIPLTRPSVLSIETVRTRSSPRCCCVSRTSFVPSGLVIVNASRIDGSCHSGKSTSTTGPMIWEILPSCIVTVWIGFY